MSEEINPCATGHAWQGMSAIPGNHLPDERCLCGKTTWCNPYQSVISNMPEEVNHPAHYDFKYEVIDVLEAWDLGFHEASAVKYIARAKHKGNEEQDISKAIWFLMRRLDQIKYPGLTAKQAESRRRE